jgi:hypothetical protein
MLLFVASVDTPFPTRSLDAYVLIVSISVHPMTIYFNDLDSDPWSSLVK